MASPSAASPAGLAREERAGDMIGAHGASASSGALHNANAPALARRALEARDGRQLVESIERRMIRPARDAAIARNSDWLAGGKRKRPASKAARLAPMIVVPALFVAAIIAFALIRAHA